VAAVYFGAVGIKQTRHAIPAGLLADLTGGDRFRDNLPSGIVSVNELKR
jgi:hypothetical protein